MKRHGYIIDIVKYYKRGKYRATVSLLLTLLVLRVLKDEEKELPNNKDIDDFVTRHGGDIVET